VTGYRSQLPDKPALGGIEDKWSAYWSEADTYRFRSPDSRADVFSIDTPPPTVSGSLHVGHVFSYTHTDIVARYQRMRGKHVFYPMGWDDNGLPTERRVQNYFGVRCEPSLPYDPDFVAPEPMAKKNSRPVIAISRRNFIELCEQLTAEDEKAFERLWRKLGLSVDWSMTYTTIGKAAQRVSQTAFLHLVHRKEAYQSQAPTLWDISFQTAVANAEVVEKEAPSAYHGIAFRHATGDIVIQTTRPELLPACVALVAHPDDERYQHLFGTEAVTPVFGVRIPVKAHELADPEKGSGLAMICTFGDITDVTWWRELQLPNRTIIGRNGRLTALDFAALPTDDPEGAQQAYDKLTGLTVSSARTAILDELREAGALRGEPKPISHSVKFYEKGDRPLEIVSSRQWFVRTLVHREELLARGRELKWYPSYMKVRYDDWVSGLNSDWLISRQRFFGVPIPVWYSLDADGNPRYDAPVYPDEPTLPIDPASDCPPGYTEDQRGRPDGFTGDPDVMDTWATSSLSPQLACGWLDDRELFERTFPMDLRPQAHDIIRTWLFYTVVRAHLENGVLPWKAAALSGWILDPDRKKMSKSQGNVVTPDAMLDDFGSDSVRYWAAKGRPGTDTAFDPQQMKIGRRLATKLLNASKFVLSFPPPAAAASITEPVDQAMIALLATTAAEATRALDDLDYTTALEKVERSFWFFCDDYLELVKSRAYGSDDATGTQSARLALRTVMDVFVRLLAPVLPFTTEEVWSWDHDASVHVASWPAAAGLRELAAGGEPELVTLASTVIAEVRKAKSTAQLSMRAEVSQVVITAPAEDVARMKLLTRDLMAVGHIGELSYREQDDPEITVSVEI
jgi:valyl-tRNA synthetase